MRKVIELSYPSVRSFKDGFGGISPGPPRCSHNVQRSDTPSPNLPSFHPAAKSNNVYLLGDDRVFSAACTEARSRFNNYRDLSPNDPETEQKVSEAWEIARLLRQNIVQGETMAGPDERYRT